MQNPFKNLLHFMHGIMVSELNHTGVISDLLQQLASAYPELAQDSDFVQLRKVAGNDNYSETLTILTRLISPKQTSEAKPLHQKTFPEMYF